MLNPEKVIVYRSQVGAISDDFWWSDGVITSTKAGDGFCIALLLTAFIISGLLLYSHFFCSRYNGKMRLGKLITSTGFFILSTGLLCKVGYLIYKVW